MILQGQKVRLRPFSPDDVSADYLGWLNDAEVVRFSNQRFRRHDQASCLAYLRSFDGSPNHFLSVRDLDDAPLGTMTAYVSPQHGTADMGIMIGARRAWGQGYGLDAWRTLGEWLLAQPGMRKLTGGTLACNVGMVRIMERAGMQREAVRVAQELVDGTPQDIVYYAKFRDA
ncbi:MAG: GNAT family N-acetyltransferase [Bordetella sp.]|nr:GNAT family N-acetyltransferase [Bordetella sp.]